jgi:5-methyltetrahydropteroyltriglutamate--homocysteine methyltransferase
MKPPERVVVCVHRALLYRKPEDISVAPDCGLKYPPCDAPFGKMKAMIEGARIVRAELAPQ